MPGTPVDLRSVRRPAGRNAPPLALAAVAVLLLAGAGMRWALGQPASPRATEPLPQTAEPAPLPAGIPAGRANPELGCLQQTYRRLEALGLRAEAAEFAERLGCPAPPPAALTGVVVERAEPPVVDAAVRTVSFKPVKDVAASYSARGTARWEDCRRQPVTFRFEGASAAEIARFVHDATGMATRALAGATPPAGFHGEVRGKPLAEALALLGVEVRAERGGVAFVPPPPLALRTAGMPLRR